MEIKNSRILVIGGAGLIGSHLVEELLKENPKEIIIYDNFCRGKKENLNDALKDSRVRIFEDGGDILHVDVLNKSMEGVDYVFHLAALWLLQCNEYERSAFEVNIEGTFNVIEACIKNNVKKLIFSSSASVYGNALKNPIEEDHPFNNNTFYGASKIAGEAMLTAVHHRRNLNFVGLRYMNVYGPRQDYKGTYVSIIMKILDRIFVGKPPIVYGDGTQSYDFVYVKDVARANILALKSNVNNGFYNVGTGVKTSINELSKILLEITGSNLPITYEPAAQTFVTDRVGSIKKAKENLGYEPTINLREGLIKSLEYYKKDRGLK